MAMDAVTKTKIMSYLNKNAIESMYIEDFFNLSTKKKYNEIDFLEFFVNYVNNVLEGKVSASDKLLIKLIEANGIFLNVSLGKKHDIDLGLVAKMRTYKDSYQKYCENKSLKIDEILLKAIAAIDKLLDSKYKDNNSNENEENSIYISKVKELEEKVAELTKTLNKEEADNELLTKRLEKTEEELGKKEDNLSQTRSTLQDREKELRRLTDIECSYEELKTSYEEVQSNNSLLEEKVSTLSEKVKKQASRIEVYDYQDEIRVKEKFLDEQVFNLLLIDNMTLDDIVRSLNSKKIIANSDDVLKSISRIKRFVNLEDCKNKTIPKLYGVSKPTIQSENSLLLEVKENSCMDIMLIADMHIDKVNNKIIEVMNKVYEYCTINNIENIFNLGDLLESNETCLQMNRYNYDSLVRLLDDIVKKFPKSNISHIILGGNHDKDFLEFGFDPITYLSDNRDDYINLGYDNAFLYLNDNNDFISLHHKGLPHEVYGTYDFLENSDKFNEKINNYYSSIGLDRDNSYIDIFAHLHRSRMDIFNNYCIVPSLTKSSNFSNCGAWHLKIFFDDKKEIKYMIFIPLLYDKKLIPSSEYVYKKVKKM